MGHLITLPLLSIFEHYGASHPHQYGVSQQYSNNHYQNTNLIVKNRKSFEELITYISKYYQNLMNLGQETKLFIRTHEGNANDSLPSTLSFNQLSSIQNKIDESIQALHLEEVHVRHMLQTHQ